MEFGRLADVDGVDFTLPTDDPRLGSVLPGAPASLTVWSGCPIISVRPAGATGKPSEPMRAYGRSFASLELNSSFYAVPAPEQVRRWSAQVPDTFRFCVKIPQTITRGDPSEIGAFCDAADAFGDRLGVCLLQLPARTSPDEHDDVVRLVERFPRHLPIAMEYRHPGWFWRGRLIGRAFAWMTARGLHANITDSPGRRDAAHVTLTSPSVVVRFVAHGGHPSDAARVRDWAQRIEGWAAQGLEQAFVYLHQPEQTGLFEGGQALERLLAERLGAAVVRPVS